MAAATPTDGSVDANDIGAVAMSLDRRLHVDAQIAGQDADVTIADGGNSITVDNAGTFATQATLQTGANTVGNIGTITTSITPGTAAANLGKAEDAAHTSGDVGVMALTRRIDTVASSAGTTGDYATLNTDANGRLYTTAQVAGAVAHDAANSGNPILNGGRATNSIEGVTQVANGDRTYFQADLNGVQLVRPHTTLEEHISERVSDTAGTSTAFTNFAAGGAGVHNYVCDVTITNTSATDAYVDLRDGTAGSVIWTFPAPANSGATHSFSLPLKGAANTALAYDVSAAITTMYISVNGFQAQG